MGGPGSGRRPRANGVNGHAAAAPAGPRVTFADLFGKMPPAPAAPPTAGPGPAASAPPPNPPTPPAPPSPPGTSAANRSFADMGAYVAVNLGVTVIGDHLRRRKLEPREVSRADLDRTKETTAEALARAIGDAEVPWWAGLCVAWGNLYLAMRVGARPLAPATTTTEPASSPETTATSAPPAPAPSPLGKPPPQPARRPVTDLSAPPPEIPLIT